MADENLTVEDGLCVITAENRPTGDRLYTSAVMNTGGFFAQQYGRFEARLKASAGTGLWPIFWLRDVNGWPPAIDVAAFDGQAPERMTGSAWYKDAAGDPSRSLGEHAVSWAGEFHVYGVVWSADELVYTLDGEEWFRSSEGLSAFDVPLFPTLNLSVFDGSEDSLGPDDSTPWPAKLYVDWVRVSAAP